jgi:hypothetical protein
MSVGRTHFKRDQQKLKRILNTQQRSLWNIKTNRKKTSPEGEVFRKAGYRKL